VIIILASRHDTIANTLVTRWEACDAQVFTPEDLSVRGWRYYPGAPHSATMVLGGHPVALEDIHGILTRLPCVWEQELVHIVPSDRPYIAAEMTAFLLCWLSELPCPVLNRPTPGCLTGPGWRREQWVFAAAQGGMRVRPVQRQIRLATHSMPPGQEPSSVTVTVVGDRCFGCVDKVLRIQARRLADAANVDLLGAQFSSPEADASFVGATLSPDVTDDGIADAILEYFLYPRPR
jgi:hypothetical protein